MGGMGLGTGTVVEVFQSTGTVGGADGFSETGVESLEELSCADL